MKRLLTGALALLLSIAASATTLNPIQLLNPTGSTSGQAIVSTGASTAPAWGNVTATSLAAQAANTVVANVTASSASPTAFVMPSCSTSTSALQYTSGTGFTCYASSASLTGATFTGALGVSFNSASFTINDAGGTGFPAFFFNKAGTNVWALTNNSGTGALTLNRYVSGTLTDSPISVSNSTGAVTMSDGIAGSPISGSTGSFTTLAASSTVSGSGFSTYLASPPAIGGTAAAAGKFTTLQATSTITPSSTAGIVGTATNDNANAGSVGEVLTASTFNTVLTSGTVATSASESLTAGDWDVQCSAQFSPAGSTTVSQLYVGASTSATAGVTVGEGTTLSLTFTTGAGQIFESPVVRESLASTTTVYCPVIATFAVSTMQVNGLIFARRVR